MLSFKKILVLTGVAFVVSVTVPAVAQTYSASTYQPGDWQPIARVNPQKPITITLINQTQAPLKYNFLDEQGERYLAEGGSRQIKVASLPANITIYDGSTPSSSENDARYNYKTSVTRNSIRLTVVPTKSFGFNVFNIDKTGAIYPY